MKDIGKYEHIHFTSNKNTRSKNVTIGEAGEQDALEEYTPLIPLLGCAVSPDFSPSRQDPKSSFLTLCLFWT